MYDIDDLIEPRKRGQNPRDPFAQRKEQVRKGYGESYQYDVLGQMFKYGDETSEILGQKYQEIKKGLNAHIEYMTPDEYMNRIGDIDVKSYLEEDSRRPIPISRERIDLYKQDALRGDKFAMPWIDYRDGKYEGQEGRHRAIMAKELGVEKMPVVIVNRTSGEENESDWMDYKQKYKKKQNPFTYDKEEIIDIDF